MFTNECYGLVRSWAIREFWCQIAIAALLSWIEQNSFGMKSYDRIEEATAAWKFCAHGT